MAVYIDFFDETNEVTSEQMKMIQELIDVTATKEAVEEAEMSVTFVTNERIQELNREYRGKDQPTDVISFAMEDEVEGEIDILGGSECRLLGDIIISIPRVKEQAGDYGHSFERELGFLSVHGFLHLLGYDHMTEEEEAIMFGKQKEILHVYGLER